VREDDDRIADGDLGEGDVADSRTLLAVSERRQPLGEGFQSEGGPAHRVRFQSLPAGQHEHDQCAREVFPEDHRGHDGDAREEVGAELQARQVNQQTQQEGKAARQREDERNLVRGNAGERAGRVGAKAQNQVEDDTRNGDRGDDDFFCAEGCEE